MKNLVVEPVETATLQFLGNARTVRRAAGPLFDDDDPVGAPHAVLDGRPVEAERVDGPKVDHFGVDAGLLGCLDAHRYHGKISENGAGGTGPHDLGRAEWNEIIHVPGRDRANGLVKISSFDNKHRIVASDRRVHQPDVIEGRAGGNDAPPGKQREHTARIHGMLRAITVGGGDAAADDDGNREITAKHVANLAHLVEELVRRNPAEIRIHELDNRTQPGQRSAKAKTDKAAFADRHPQQSLGKALVDALGGTGVTAAHPMHILPQNDHVCGFLHIAQHDLRHRLNVFDLFHLCGREILDLAAAHTPEFGEISTHTVIDLRRVGPQGWHNPPAIPAGFLLRQRCSGAIHHITRAR